MTESERIITQGIVPVSFLNEEVRNGFFVTRERKKIWAILIDLLLQLDRICKKHNLQFFVTGGTLLGAVRHHGFIPWDDDLDVAMLRADYEELQKHADEFEHPYFLQTPYTDSNYFFSFIRLGNDNTTYCSKMFVFQGYHAGICIDIFPIDNWDCDKGKLVYNKIKYYVLENSTFMRMKNPRLSLEDKSRVAQWSGISPLFAYEEIQRLAKTFVDEKTNCYANAVVTIWSYGKDVYQKSAIEKLLLFDFESIKVPVPCGYIEILEGLYGNYMQFPPIEKRGSWHDGMLIEPDKPYLSVLEEYKRRNI